MVNPLWPGTSKEVPATISIRSGAPFFPRRPLKMIEGVDPDRGSLPSTVS